MMDFVFIGGTYRGWRTLASLIDGGFVPRLAFILKEDDHETERYSERIAETARELRIPFRVTKTLSQDDYRAIRDVRPEFAVVCGWRTIIDPAISDSMKLGLVAAHDSLLPRYRGFAPINWAIINGETETGVTLFLIGDGEVDSGNIIDQEKVAIGPDDYARDVYEKITEATISLYARFFRQYAEGSIALTKQDEVKATYTCKRSPEDGRIDWTKSDTDVYNLIRALAHPYPGAYCFLNGKRFRVHRASPGVMRGRVYAGRIPGKAIRIDESGIEILCGTGSVTITEWEEEGSGVPESPSVLVRSITTTLQ